MKDLRDIDNAAMMGTLHFPPCPECGRTMVRANYGRPDQAREKGILVCCDVRCLGREPEPPAGSPPWRPPWMRVVGAGGV